MDELVERLVRAREGGTPDGVPLERLTADQRQEWIGRQALDGGAGGHAAGGGEAAAVGDRAQARAEAAEFLRKLHRDVEPLFAVPRGAEAFFSPVHEGAPDAAGNAGPWQSAQARMAGELGAELAGAEQGAGRLRRFEEGFGQWAGERFATEREPLSAPAAGSGGLEHRTGEGPAPSPSAAGMSQKTLGRVFETAKRQVGQNLDDGSGLDRLDTEGGLHRYLDELWVSAHTVTEAGRVLREEFARWRDSAGPDERAWLDGGPGPGPTPDAVPGADSGARDTAPPEPPVGGPAQAGPLAGPRPPTVAPRVVPAERNPNAPAENGDEVLGSDDLAPGFGSSRAGQEGPEAGSGGAPRQSRREGPPADRVFEAAERAFERMVRREVEPLLTSARMSAEPRLLVGEITRAVDRLFLGRHAAGESSAAVPGVRRAVERAVRGLGSRLPRVRQVFERAAADERARQAAADHFEVAADRLTYGPRGSARLLDTASPSGGPGWVLSGGGRERLRREWLAEADTDRQEIFGDLGDPGVVRSDGGRAEADAERRWQEVRAARERELPGRLELQSRKEDAAHQVVDAVREAAQSGDWRRALDGLGQEFRDLFPLRDHEAGAPVQRDAAQSLGETLHQALDRWAATDTARREPGAADRIIAGHLLPEDVGRRIALNAVRRSETDRARAEAVAAAAGDPRAVGDAADRFVETHVGRVAELFDRHFDPGPAPGRIDAAAVAGWQAGRNHLTDSLGHHLAFELDATHGIGRWAQGTREAADGRHIDDEDYDRIAATTRQDWFETYNRLFTGHLGPDGLNTEKWLLHEETTGGRFHRHTDPGPPAHPDAPEPPHNAEPLAAVPHPDADRPAWEPGSARRPDAAAVREPDPGPDTGPQHPTVTPQHAAALENFLRNPPALAAGTALTRQVLSELADRVVDWSTKWREGGHTAGRGEEDAGLCVTLLEGFARVVVPGMRLRAARDDLALDGADAARRLVDRLRPVDTWQALADSVRQAAVAHPAGEGAPRRAYAMVYGQRRTGIGHAFAVASDGQTVWFVDLRAAPGKRVSQAEPRWRPLYARAAVFTPRGELPAAEASQHPAKSQSTSRVLLDPPLDRRYGGIGAEAELQYPLEIRGPDGKLISPLSGTVLAVHYPTGFEVVVDVHDFGAAPDDTLHSISRPGLKPRQFLIPEIVTPPFAVLPGDGGRLSASRGLDMLDEVRRLLGQVNEYRRPLPLSDLLPKGEIDEQGRRKGWFTTKVGDKTKVFESPGGSNHPAYTQITVGIPAARMLDILEYAASRLPPVLGKIAPFFTTARLFGMDVAAKYASELAGRRVDAADVDLLLGIESVTEVWGYAWLLFTHVAAGPWGRRFKPPTLTKNMLPVASRASFSKIHAQLSPGVRDYLDRNHDWIRDRFVSVSQSALNRLRGGNSAHPEDGNGILNEEIKQRNKNSGEFLVGDFLTTTLRGRNPRGTEFGLWETTGMSDSRRVADGGLDSNGGSLVPPLVLLELRHLVTASGQLMSPGELRQVSREVMDVARQADERAARPQAMPDGISGAEAINAILDHPQWKAAFSAVQQLANPSHVRGDGLSQRFPVDREEASRALDTFFSYLRGDGPGQRFPLGKREEINRALALFALEGRPLAADVYDSIEGLVSSASIEGLVSSTRGLLSAPAVPSSDTFAAVAPGQVEEAARLLPLLRGQSGDARGTHASEITNAADWTHLSERALTFKGDRAAAEWAKMHFGALSELSPPAVRKSVWAYASPEDDGTDTDTDLALPFDAGFVPVNGQLNETFKETMQRVHRVRFGPHTMHDVVVGEGSEEPETVRMRGDVYVEKAKSYVLQRIADLDSVVRRRRTPEHVVVRSLVPRDQFPDVPPEKLAGREINERGFLRVSLGAVYEPDPDTEYSLHLFVPKGTNAAYAGSGRGPEDLDTTLLLARGQKWKVLHAIQAEDDVWHLYGRLLSSQSEVTPRHAADARPSVTSVPVPNRGAALTQPDPESLRDPNRHAREAAGPPVPYSLGTRRPSGELRGAPRAAARPGSWHTATPSPMQSPAFPGGYQSLGAAGRATVGPALSSRAEDSGYRGGRRSVSPAVPDRGVGTSAGPSGGRGTGGVPTYSVRRPSPAPAVRWPVRSDSSGGSGPAPAASRFPATRPVGAAERIASAAPRPVAGSVSGLRRTSVDGRHMTPPASAPSFPPAPAAPPRERGRRLSTGREPRRPADGGDRTAGAPATGGGRSFFFSFPSPLNSHSDSSNPPSAPGGTASAPRPASALGRSRTASPASTADGSQYAPMRLRVGSGSGRGDGPSLHGVMDRLSISRTGRQAAGSSGGRVAGAPVPGRRPAFPEGYRGSGDAGRDVAGEGVGPSVGGSGHRVFGGRRSASPAPGRGGVVPVAGLGGRPGAGGTPTRLLRMPSPAPTAGGLLGEGGDGRSGSGGAGGSGRRSSLGVRGVTPAASPAGVRRSATPDALGPSRPAPVVSGTVAPGVRVPSAGPSRPPAAATGRGAAPVAVSPGTAASSEVFVDPFGPRGPIGPLGPGQRDEARGVLDGLLKKLAADAGTQVSLEQVTGWVLHLDPRVLAGEGEYERLLRLVEHARRSGASDALTSFDALSWYYLTRSGLLRPQTEISGPPGRPGRLAQGRDWTSSPVTSLDISTLMVPLFRFEEHHTSDRLVAAPWSLEGDGPYVVRAEVEHGRVVLHHPAVPGGRLFLTYRHFGGLLTKDVLLGERRGGAAVVLAGSSMGAGNLDLPRAVAAMTRLDVWASTGEVRLVTGFTGLPRLAPHTGDRRQQAAGMFVRIPYPGPLPVRGTPQSVVVGFDTRGQPVRVPDSHLLTQPIVSRSTNTLLGRASHIHQDWAGRDPVTGDLDRLYEYSPSRRASRSYKVPWRDGPSPYFFSAHGAVGGGYVLMEREHGERVILDGVQTGRWLRRRPSVESLAKDVPIVLNVCYAGVIDSVSLSSVGQGVVNVTGHHKLFAADQNVVLRRPWPTEDQRVPLRNYLGSDEASSVVGRWLEFRPDPVGERLDDLVSVAGVADAGAAETTVRLVRLLRMALDASVEDRSDFRDLLRGMGRLERLRRADPVSSSAPLTLEYLVRAAREFDQGAIPRASEAAFFALLSAARNGLTRLPGQPTTDFMPVPAAGTSAQAGPTHTATASRMGEIEFAFPQRRRDGTSMTEAAAMQSSGRPRADVPSIGRVAGAPVPGRGPAFPEGYRGLGDAGRGVAGEGVGSSVGGSGHPVFGGRRSASPAPGRGGVVPVAGLGGRPGAGGTPTRYLRMPSPAPTASGPVRPEDSRRGAVLGPSGLPGSAVRGTSRDGRRVTSSPFSSALPQAATPREVGASAAGDSSSLFARTRRNSYSSGALPPRASGTPAPVVRPVSGAPAPAVRPASALIPSRPGQPARTAGASIEPPTSGVPGHPLLRPRAVFLSRPAPATDRGRSPGPTPPSAIPSSNRGNRSSLLTALHDNGRIKDVNEQPDPGPLGPDLFGLLEPFPTPTFLVNPRTRRPYDHTTLTADQQVHYLQLLDLTKSRPDAAAMNPARWHEGSASVSNTLDSTRWAPTTRDHERLASPTVTVPLLVHAIWVGSPLRDHGPSAGFWENYREAAADFGEEATFVLWTDVPRDDFTDVRHLTVEPAEPHRRDVWRMARWADEAGIVLVSPFEVFHRGRPMRLHRELLTELAKQNPRGWAAFSDGLRLEALHAIGGLYSDGDNAVEDLSSFDQVVETPAFATYADRHRFGNSAFAAPAGHPFITQLLNQLAENYRKSQPELYGPEEILSGPEGYFTEFTRARRNSVLLRTGPESMRPVARHFGYSSARELPSIEGIFMGDDASWLKTPVPPPQSTWTPAATLVFTQRVVHTMVRSLYNRNGDLHLTEIDSAVRRHPRPAEIWEAALGFIADRDDLRSRVRSITTERMTARGQSTTVQLPDTVTGFFRPAPRRPQLGDGDGWWLGERARPVDMIAPDGRAQPLRLNGGGGKRLSTGLRAWFGKSAAPAPTGPSRSPVFAVGDSQGSSDASVTGDGSDGSHHDLMHLRGGSGASAGDGHSLRGMTAHLQARVSSLSDGWYTARPAPEDSRRGSVTAPSGLAGSAVRGTSRDGRRATPSPFPSTLPQAPAARDAGASATGDSPSLFARTRRNSHSSGALPPRVLGTPAPTTRPVQGGGGKGLSAGLRAWFGKSAAPAPTGSPRPPQPLRRPLLGPFSGEAPPESQFVLGGGPGSLVEVPRELHFVWLGGSLSRSAEENLRAWAGRARSAGWRVRIWTDPQAAEVNAAFFTTHFTDDAAGTSLITEELFGSRKPGFFQVSPQHRVYKYGLSHGGYALASDVARYAILRRYGGVYVDVDIAPGRVVLPERPLRMPLGEYTVPFLAPMIRDGFEIEAARHYFEVQDEWPSGDELVEQAARLNYAYGWLGNSFIVTPPRSRFLERLYQSIPDGYLRAQMKNPNFNPRREAATYTGPSLWKRQMQRGTWAHRTRPRVDPDMLEQWVGLRWVTADSAREAGAPPGLRAWFGESAAPALTGSPRPPVLSTGDNQGSPVAGAVAPLRLYGGSGRGAGGFFPSVSRASGNGGDGRRPAYGEPTAGETTPSNEERKFPARNILNRPTTFRLDEVKPHVMLDAGNQVLAIYFPSKQGDERTADWWSRNTSKRPVTGFNNLNPTVSHVAPWSKDYSGQGPLFVYLHAGPESFRVRTQDGRTLKVDGATLAEICLNDADFQQALQGRPDSSVVLLACEAGHNMEPGGGGYDFGRVLLSRGFSRDVYAPTEPINLVPAFAAINVDNGGHFNRVAERVSLRDEYHSRASNDSVTTGPPARLRGGGGKRLSTGLRAFGKSAAPALTGSPRPPVLSAKDNQGSPVAGAVAPLRLYGGSGRGAGGFFPSLSRPSGDGGDGRSGSGGAGQSGRRSWLGVRGVTPAAPPAPAAIPDVSGAEGRGRASGGVPDSSAGAVPVVRRAEPSRPELSGLGPGVVGRRSGLAGTAAPLAGLRRSATPGAPERPVFPGGTGGPDRLRGSVSRSSYPAPVVGGAAAPGVRVPSAGPSRLSAAATGRGVAPVGVSLGTTAWSQAPLDLTGAPGSGQREQAQGILDGLLRKSADAGVQVSLEQVVRGVLHLNPRTRAGEGEYERLLRLVEHAGRSGASDALASFDALGRYHLEAAGVWGAVTEIPGQGRDWASPTLVTGLDLSTVIAPHVLLDPAFDGPVEAPWSMERDSPYVVRAEVEHDRVVLHTPTRQLHLSYREFAEVLERDSLLRDRPAAPILLAGSYMGAGDLDLPRMVAQVTRRNVYSSTGEIRLDPGLTGARLAPHRGDRVKQPIGRFVRSPHPGPAPTRNTRESWVIGTDAGGQWTEVHDSQLLTRPIVASSGNTIGRFSMPPETWASADVGLGFLAEQREYHQSLNADADPILGTAQPFPWLGGPTPYFFAAHATPGRIHFKRADGEWTIADGEQTGRWLKRRPSLSLGPIVLHACGSGMRNAETLKSAAEDVATATGQTVFAPNARVGTWFSQESDPTALAESGLNQVVSTIETSDASRAMRWLEFRPELTGERLVALARIVGLDGPVAQRLVRTLRFALGATVEDRPDFQRLLRGAVAIYEMRLTELGLRQGSGDELSVNLLEDLVQAQSGAAVLNAPTESREAAYRQLFDAARTYRELQQQGSGPLRHRPSLPDAFRAWLTEQRELQAQRGAREMRGGSGWVGPSRSQAPVLGAYGSRRVVSPHQAQRLPFPAEYQGLDGGGVGVERRSSVTGSAGPAGRRADSRAGWGRTAASPAPPERGPSRNEYSSSHRYRLRTASDVREESADRGADLRGGAAPGPSARRVYGASLTTPTAPLQGVQPTERSGTSADSNAVPSIFGRPPSADPGVGIAPPLRLPSMRPGVPQPVLPDASTHTGASGTQGSYLHLPQPRPSSRSALPQRPVGTGARDVSASATGSGPSFFFSRIRRNSGSLPPNSANLDLS
ncbi:lonely Cys domain-containing protein [Streptomyces mirabilis]|uniref:lonely Cys domain-containing protein n=1 Tax=Streptomyces mirabilis TaxID=68239 RepID=UPI00364C3D0B